MIPFYAFGSIAVVASLLVIMQRNAMHSLLLLIMSFGALSGLYVLLDAPFAAVIQIIVYAGAIMVLFLFVVMLLNVSQEHVDGPGGAAAFPTRVGVALAALLGVELVWTLSRVGRESGGFAGGAVSSVRVLGRVLFTEYAFAFEVTSVLILVAMVGAVVLARHEDRSE